MLACRLAARLVSQRGCSAKGYRPDVKTMANQAERAVRTPCAVCCSRDLIGAACVTRLALFDFQCGACDEGRERRFEDSNSRWCVGGVPCEGLRRGRFIIEPWGFSEGLERADESISIECKPKRVGLSFASLSNPWPLHAPLSVSERTGGRPMRHAAPSPVDRGPLSLDSSEPSSQPLRTFRVDQSKYCMSRSINLSHTLIRSRGGARN